MESKRWSWICTLILLLSFFLLNCHFFFTATTIPFPSEPVQINASETCGSTKIPAMLCVPKQAHAKFHGEVWPIIDILAFSVIPSVLVIMSNIAIIAKVTRAAIRRATMTQGHTPTKQVNFMTTTLIIISFMFVATTVPVGVLLIMANHRFVRQDKRPTEDFGNAMRLSILWSYFNNALNFYFYLFTGQKFRNELFVIRRKRSKAAPVVNTNLGRL